MKISLILAAASILCVQSCQLGEHLKSVGQHCKDDSECYNGGNADAVSCKAGVCECNDGFLSKLQWFSRTEQRSVCLPAPFRDQPCTTVCQKPFSCVNSIVGAIKTCQCHAPYISKDGWCYKECGSNEIFELGDCRKRCEDDENKSNKGICKKMGKLGDPCDTKNECWAQFSQCINGICSCPRGFEPTPKKDMCQSSHHWCPIGDPVRTKDGKLLECKVVKTGSSSDVRALFVPFPSSTGQLEDNCGEDQFCMLTSGESYYVEGAIGHCCPKPKFNCPIGLPHPNATCGRSITYRPMPDDSNAPYCPYGSHTCVRFSLGAGLETSLCCPTACDSNQVLSDGTCYPKRNHGDHCQIDNQCKGHNGICEKGKCTCGTGYVEEGSIGYKYCRRVCKDKEALGANDQCLPKLKLGERCDPQAYNQCPINSFCTEKKICDCFCGYVKLADNVCAPQPSCPMIEASKNPSPIDAVTLSTLTLCRVPGGQQSSHSSVVDTCPKGQYCVDYVSEYGLCCPMPDKPFCPNGAIPGDKCDPMQPVPCGPMAFCNRYISPAGNDTTTGYVCCSASHPEPELPLNLLLRGRP